MPDILTNRRGNLLLGIFSQLSKQSRQLKGLATATYTKAVWTPLIPRFPLIPCRRLPPLCASSSLAALSINKTPSCPYCNPEPTIVYETHTVKSHPPVIPKLNFGDGGGPHSCLTGVSGLQAILQTDLRGLVSSHEEALINPRPDAPTPSIISVILFRQTHACILGS